MDLTETHSSMLSGSNSFSILESVSTKSFKSKPNSGASLRIDQRTQIENVDAIPHRNKHSNRNDTKFKQQTLRNAEETPVLKFKQRSLQNRNSNEHCEKCRRNSK